VRPLYARLEYAKAFGGGAFDAPAWDTALIARPVPGEPLQDALGCYPLAAIRPGADLAEGVDELRAAGAVSVALVPDPLTGPSPSALANAFEVCRPFKTHYLVDPSRPSRPSDTHRRWVRKAMDACRVEPVALAETLDAWIGLYGELVGRHEVRGLTDFEPGYFAALAGFPEVKAVAAFQGRTPVAMALWVQADEVAYYHLGASSPEGYRLRASYAVMAAALELIAEGRIAHLGGASGLADDPADGLARFKRGFANRQVMAWFCGAVLHPDHYRRLSAGRDDGGYFPGYRAP
jgi:hypothetical protein